MNSKIVKEKKKEKLLKGSGVLVVILSAITFSIYISSTFAEEEHYQIMQERYSKNLIQNYEKNLNNVEEIYETLYNKYYE